MTALSNADPSSMAHVDFSIYRQVTSGEEVFSRFSSPDTAINELVSVLLSEELTNLFCSLVGRYETVRSSGMGPEAVFARGCVLFLLFHRFATLPVDQKPNVELNQIARDDDFLRVFQAFYKIPPDVGLRNLSFHASGTTSFIFKALTHRHGLCALKVIQAPYVQLPAIQQSTEQYDKNYGLHVKFSPRIHRSERLWILMDFIEGSNLNDFLNLAREKFVFLSDDYVAVVSSVFHKVTEALAYYESQEPPIVHGDLTPFNILVEHTGNVPTGIKLIDFGPNYVLKDRLGSRRIFAEAFSRTELFTAPEVISGTKDASLQSDLFSLGMISLDMFCEIPLRKETVGVKLREIWRNPTSVGIAQIIEDLIDDEPENRLLVLRNTANKSVYVTLDAALQDHVALYKDLAVQQRQHTLSALAQAVFNLDVLKSARNIAKISKLNDRSYNIIGKWQRRASAANLCCYSIIVIAFFVYTGLDFNVKYGFEIPLVNSLVNGLKTAIGFYPNHLHVGDVAGNLPGRAVALTFGLIASRYYANIFSSLRVTHLDGWLQVATNSLLRLNSISYFVPIMVAIVYDPHLWPYCAAIGTAFPALNNLFCRQAAEKSHSKADATFSIEDYHRSETKGFLKEYSEWWILMLSYSFFLLIIGVLLAIGWASDEPIYAFIVCFVNIVKIYRNNCGHEAPRVSGNLSRAFFYLRRWKAKAVANPTSERPI